MKLMITLGSITEEDMGAMMQKIHSWGCVAGPGQITINGISVSGTVENLCMDSNVERKEIPKVVLDYAVEKPKRHKKTKPAKKQTKKRKEK